MLSFEISPSLLSADQSHLVDECTRVISAGVNRLHIDVMDGHFVPNLSVGPVVVAALRKHLDVFLECHVMVTDPEKWVHPCANAGSSMYSFHVEAVHDSNIVPLIRRIRSAGMKAGLVLSPPTPVSAVVEYATFVDMVTIMAVEPGFGGQPFNTNCLTKIKDLRAKFPCLDIQVDGGMSLDTISMAAEAGANIFVSGSAIFDSASPGQIIAEMKKRLAAIHHPC